jgi:hypothetical protein
MSPTNTRLLIDPEFQRLIPPLSSDEYKQLERNLIQDGCREPISVWNNVILDGHNRYEICTRHEIPFSTVPIDFSCREAAISWICDNQLGRRNITEETRKYLIGKRYEAEKNIGPPNIRGVNCYPNEVAYKFYMQPQNEEYRNHTAKSLAEEYRISPSTVMKYNRYANVLDRIAERDDTLVPKILTGQVKVSQNNLIQISQMPKNQLHLVCGLLVETPDVMLPYQEGRKILAGHVTYRNKHKTSVKDMPTYDPDSEISSLALTIPSWCASIERVKSKANMREASVKARQQLLDELKQLAQTVELMLITIKGDA